MQRSNYPTPTGACRLLEDFIVGPGNLPMVRCTLIAVVLGEKGRMEIESHN